MEPFDTKYGSHSDNFDIGTKNNNQQMNNKIINK